MRTVASSPDTLRFLAGCAVAVALAVLTAEDPIEAVLFFGLGALITALSWRS